MARSRDDDDRYDDDDVDVVLLRGKGAKDFLSRLLPADEPRRQQSKSRDDDRDRDDGDDDEDRPRRRGFFEPRR